MDDLQRQLRIAIFAFLVIVPLGTVGFMMIEGWAFIEALYVTVVTLSTVGYGDRTPVTTAGQAFAVVLIISGLSAFAFGGQAFLQVFTSPILRNARQRRLTLRKLQRLNQHYIVCGDGELVDRTVEYLLQGAQARRNAIRHAQYRPIDTLLDRIFGDDADGHFLWLRRPLQYMSHQLIRIFRTQATILDVLVVITSDPDYANHLHSNGLLVILGDATDNDALLDAEITRAQAIMVMLDDDTETLLSVLTARALAPHLHITAAVLDDELSPKIMRAGANWVSNPFNTAGRFLNNATFRPVVNAYFNGLLFDLHIDYRLIQARIEADSAWVGQTIGALDLRRHYHTGAIGIRYADRTFGYAPEVDTILQAGDMLILVTPLQYIEALFKAAQGKSGRRPRDKFQATLPHHTPLRSETHYSLIESETIVQSMSKHFIIVGNDRVARSAISSLDPTRPFVIISNDNTLTSDLIKRGFRVIHGNPTDDEVLLRAGIDRAQAIMVALEKKADSVLTVISSRALNDHILITSTANSDDMIDKLKRSGADRVVSPFHIGARFILLTMTRPELSDFVYHILYNYETKLETTEIYLEADSAWIGQTVAALALRRRFQAGLIGVLQAHHEEFVYAPDDDYVLQAHQVLVLVLPMNQSDALRQSAHGSDAHAPKTLRARVLENDFPTPAKRNDTRPQ